MYQILCGIRCFLIRMLKNIELVRGKTDGGKLSA